MDSPVAAKVSQRSTHTLIRPVSLRRYVLPLGIFRLNYQAEEKDGLISPPIVFPRSASYMSPEVYRSKAHNPLASDIWSLGVIFYVIATGMPIYAQFGDPAFKALEKGHFDPLLDHYQSRGCRVPQGWIRDIIRPMLDPVASLRPSPGELLARLSPHQEVMGRAAPIPH